MKKKVDIRWQVFDDADAVAEQAAQRILQAAATAIAGGLVAVAFAAEATYRRMTGRSITHRYRIPLGGDRPGRITSPGGMCLRFATPGGGDVSSASGPLTSLEVCA